MPHPGPVALVAALLIGVSTAFAAPRLVPTTCPAPADAALEVLEAKDEMEGIGAEHAWLAQNRPGWTAPNQAEFDEKGRSYDLLYIEKDGQKQTICFDITAFFGKF